MLKMLVNGGNGRRAGVISEAPKYQLKLKDRWNGVEDIPVGCQGAVAFFFLVSHQEQLALWQSTM